MALSVHAIYDVGQSWDVLHHTGDLWQALSKAAALVRPEGHALYRRAPFCPLWRIEKRLYAGVPSVARAYVRKDFQAAGRLPSTGRATAANAA